MIAKYGGVCAICKGSTRAGVDFYDVKAKESYHAVCKENVDVIDESTSATDAEALAIKLGFKTED